MIRLNLGSGENKIDGFINVDAEPDTKPDLCLDFRIEPLPFGDGEVDEIWILHCIEHLERRYWGRFFFECRRVLRPDGMFVLAYPEFRVCCDYYLKNYREKQDYWLATIFGRQHYPADYHVTAVNSAELKTILEGQGFYKISYKPEDEPNEFNSTLIAHRPPAGIAMREDVLVQELGL